MSAEALRRECAEMTRFCRELSPEEWATPSAAPGWRVQDVVAHVGAALHALFTPAALRLVTSKDIERTNDEFVDARRGWAPSAVLAEYERWSARLLRVSGPMTRGPLARVPVPLGELGRFPLALLVDGALVFDQHVHLRHDIAPALGRPAPGTDEVRMAAVLGWMFAVLANQLRAAPPDRSVTITLHGPGGGTWRVGPGAVVVPGSAPDAAARVSGTAAAFPDWATTRSPWREHDVEIAGDQAYGARFLDAVNVV